MSDAPDQELPDGEDDGEEEEPEPEPGPEPEPEEPTDEGEPGEMPEALATDPVLTNAIDVPSLGFPVDVGAADAVSSAQEAARAAQST